MKTKHKIIHLPTNDVDIETHLLFKNRSNEFSIGWNRTLSWKAQHLYILSDEDIKEGDWYLDTQTNTVYKCDSDKESLSTHDFDEFKKIIATTNPKLISDGVAEIPQSLIKAYAEEQMDYVELEYDKCCGRCNDIDDKCIGDKLKLKDNQVVWSRVDEDCKKCNQTKQNCECHISDEVKHKQFHDFVNNIIGNNSSIHHSSLGLKPKKMYSREEVEKIIRKTFIEGGKSGMNPLRDFDLDNWIKENLK